MSGDQWRVGVYRTPFSTVDMSAAGWKRFRLKEWHYVSFTTEEWYVAIGLVQLGYVAHLFCLCGRSRSQMKARPLEYGALSPLGAGLFRCRSSSVVGQDHVVAEAGAPQVSIEAR